MRSGGIGRTTLFLGQSGAVLRLRALATRLANAPFPLLIQGETGVGKYELARFIHEASSRRQAPFIDVNCANLSATLFESELFGHERGAFTDARERHDGRVAAAVNGTLLFDEIDTLESPLQSKLLRFVDRRQYERVGGRETVVSDARLIFASNRYLQDLVDDGEFREDLFARINWTTLHVPPLRDRRDDIPFLAGTFLEEARLELKRDVLRWGGPALKALSAYNWPGNVRELRSVTFVAAFLHDGSDPITVGEVDELFEGRHPTAPVPSSLRIVRGIAEKEIIAEALRKTEGNRLRAATILKIGRRTLQHKIAKYGL